MVFVAGASGACAKLVSFDGAPTTADPTNSPGEAPSRLIDNITISPTDLDFGTPTCKVESAPKDIVIGNATAAEVDFTISMPEGSEFLIRGPLSGKIPSGGSVSIPVSIAPTHAGEAKTGIVVNAGESVVEVLAHAIGTGAVLELATTSLDFGQIRLGSEVASTVMLKNTGTGVATIASFSGVTGEIDVIQAGEVALAPSESTAINVRFRGGATAKDVEATLSPTITTPLCADVPKLTARGSAIDTTITISNADFGTMPCNTAANTKEITLSNYEPTARSITSATLPAGSPFTITTAFPLNLPGATGTTPGVATLTVALPSSGATLGVREQDITMTIPGADMPTRTAKARVDVLGAILEIGPPTTINFRSDRRHTDYDNFLISNKGNAEISVSYDFKRTLGPAAWFPERGTDRIPAGGTALINMGFLPDEKGDHEATMTPRRQSGAQACTTMPVATAHGVGY